MKCTNCGFENVEDARFCISCGTKLNDVGQQDNVVFEEEDNKEETDKMDVAKLITDNAKKVDFEKVKQIPKKTLMGIAVVVVVLIVVICAAANAKPTINLDNYVTVTTSGYDGYGSATLEIDWAAIEEKYGDKIAYSNQAKRNYGDWLLLFDEKEMLMSYVNLEYDTYYYNWTNGEKLNYRWSIDEDELYEFIDCRLKFKDGSIKISGLAEVVEYDPFEEVEVVFSGADSEGYAEVEYYGSLFEEYKFNIDRDHKLYNGDSIRVSLPFGDEEIEHYASTYGQLITVTQKDYTVSGLGKYITAISDMDADTVAAIKAQADIAVDEYVADFSGDVTVNSITYLGDYLLVAEDNDESEQNIYGLVYKINSFAQASVAYEGANVEQYYYIQFDNIVVNEDGTCEVDLADYYTPYWQYFTINLRYGEFAWLTNYYTFYGYEDFDAMKLDFEDVNDAYSCEWNVSENGEV